MMKRLPWIAKLLKPLFRREYWIASPHRMALGISIGLFFAFALMIFPIQMLIAALACLFFKANLPMSIGGCWVTNPLTIPPFVVAAVWVGSKLESLGIPLGEKVTPIPVVDLEINWGHFLAGSFLMGLVAAIIAYPVVMILCSCLSKKKKA